MMMRGEETISQQQVLTEVCFFRKRVCIQMDIEDATNSSIADPLSPKFFLIYSARILGERGSAMEEFVASSISICIQTLFLKKQTSVRTCCWEIVSSPRIIISHRHHYYSQSQKNLESEIL
jgi:hypothetical protein